MRVSQCLLLMVVVPILVHSQSPSSEIRPTAYHLKIDVSNLATSPTFQGNISINVTVDKPTHSILLHSRGICVTSSTVRVLRRSLLGGGWADEPVSNVSTADDTLSINFPRQIVKTQYRVSLDFQGSYQQTMTGFAKVEYHFRKLPKYLGVTSFEPTNARAVFPCFDSPEHRTKFILDITANKTQHVLSNVKPTYIRNVGETTEVYHFNSYPEMPVHLLGWVVFEPPTYMVYSDNTTATEIHTRAPYPYSNHTSWSGQLSALLLEAVGNYTQYPYPLAKLEQVVIPEFFSGMSEGWGIISYSEEAILVTPDRTSAEDKQSVALGLSRSMVQQWFGDILTVDSWENLWLAKGLAEYLQYPIAASLPEMSSWELEEQIVLELTQPALTPDVSQHVLVSKSQDHKAEYHDHVKYKGGAVVKMLHDILGSELFQNCLVLYFNAELNPNSVIEPSSLWNLLYEVAGEGKIDLSMKSIAELMTEWTSASGHPVLDVSWDGTQFSISQEKDGEWYVPVTYALQESQGTVSKAWLQPGKVLLIPATNIQWILLNINQTGLYRVNYNNTLWQLLYHQLDTDLTQLPRLSRAQLIDDAFSLTLNGIQSISFLLQFTTYLQYETDYYPWHTALRNFQNLIDKLYGHSSYNLLRAYVQNLMSKVVDEVGMISKPQDSHIDKLRRVLVLRAACALGHHSCLSKANSILRSWMTNTYFDADLSTALLCAGVSNSSTGLWQAVWAMHEYSVYPTIKGHILRSLACSRDHGLLHEFLHDVTSTRAPIISDKDKTIFLQTLASTPYGAELLLDWLLVRTDKEVNSTNSTFNDTASVESSNENAAVDSNSTVLDTDSELEVNPISKETDEETVENNTSHSKARKTREVHVSDELTEDDVLAILSYIIPKLTTTEQGMKLETLATQNLNSFSNNTALVIQAGATQAYRSASWANKYNAHIASWLEEAATTTVAPSDTSTSIALKPSPAPTSRAAIAHSSLVFSLLVFWLLFSLIL